MTKEEENGGRSVPCVLSVRALHTPTGPHPRAGTRAAGVQRCVGVQGVRLCTGGRREGAHYGLTVYTASSIMPREKRRGGKLGGTTVKGCIGCARSRDAGRDEYE